MNTLLTKLLSGIGIVSVIFVLGFISGYHTKSNQVNSATAKQDIKLATLQSKYDNIANITQLDYLTDYEGMINESSYINSTSIKHDWMWHIFKFNHITNTLCQDCTTDCLDAKTTTRLKNGKLNTVQLLFLQSYIKQIQGLE